MLELEPGSILWMQYQVYRKYGGDPEVPEIDTIGRFIRKLVIWTPLRWLHSISRPVPLVWAVTVVIAFFNPIAAFRIGLALLFILLLYDAADMLAIVVDRYKRSRPVPTGKGTIKLR